MKGFMQALNHRVDDPIRYELSFTDQTEPINPWIGHKLRLEFLGEKKCVACGRKVKKLYQGGYCFPCVTTLAETDLCIVKPHECHFHLGTCRDEDFGKAYCMVPHYVYLAVSSQAKVGLTRKGREFTRWVDQGAHQAVIFAQLGTRKLAGDLEMEIAKNMPDKTNWRHLVQGITTDVDLLDLAMVTKEKLPESMQAYVLPEFALHTFTYPVMEGVAPKAISVNLENNPIESVLLGIRGQYLLFEQGAINVKKHAGMLCKVDLE